jgi:hypothetical protein
MDHFAWYKNVPHPQERHQRFLASWAKSLPFFLTGVEEKTEAASTKVIAALTELIEQISTYTTTLVASIEAVNYPVDLDDYLGQSNSPLLINFNTEMKRLYQVLSSAQAQQIISTYHQAETLRGLWGSPYHYLCFSKALDPKDFYPSRIS